MKPLQLAVLGIILSLIVWGSLFITVLNQSHQTHQLLKNDHQLLSQDTAILNAQKRTEADLETKINSLQDHIDCLFNLATRPAGSRIADAATCTIASAAPTTADSTNASAPQQPSSKPEVFVFSPQPQSAPSSMNKQPAPKPAKSLACTLTLGLLGCTN